MAKSVTFRILIQTRRLFVGKDENGSSGTERLDRPFQNGKETAHIQLLPETQMNVNA